MAHSAVKLAVNYSAPARRLVEAGRVQLDVFKSPEWPDLLADIRQVLPSYAHFALYAGWGHLGDVDWDTIERCLEVSDTAYINMHLAASRKLFTDIPLDSTDPGHRKRLVAGMIEDVLTVKERFAGRMSIVLENAMWDPDPPWEFPQHVLQPDVIEEVVRETECEFLLDVAHALCTALHFGIDPREYIARLPVDKIREMHVTGITWHRNGYWTDHYTMRDEDWALTEWALERVRAGDWRTPDVVAFEYGGVGPGFEENTDEAVLAEQLPRLRELL